MPNSVGIARKRWQEPGLLGKRSLSGCSVIDAERSNTRLFFFVVVELVFARWPPPVKIVRRKITIQDFERIG